MYNALLPSPPGEDVAVYVMIARQLKSRINCISSVY